MTILRTKFLFFFLFLCLTSYTVEDKSTLKILTPSLSERQTKKLRLENGLEVYLISDPGCHQSGAAMAVSVGSFDDPENRPGMAHFIEHMLFMGTEKYPGEEEYQNFLTTHGGKCNAFTCEDRTVYIFACDNPHFEACLDRFASLFVAPLFRSSSLKREAQAIDQEFCKDVPLDAWRVLYVKKELANPEHPFHRFCIGNKETLSDVTSDELRNWYLSHYSADLMHLVVYGSDSMEALEKKAVDIFSEVPKREVVKVSCTKPVFLENVAKQILTIAPLTQLKTVQLSWELPSCFCNEKEFHADEFVAFVLGHEGDKSLFSLLKKENLAEGLSARTEQIGRDKALFTLSVDLTNKGIEAYENVVDKCFQAISVFTKLETPKYIFDEMRLIKKTKYSYQSREEPFDYVTELAYAMVDEPLETFPDKTLLPTSYNPENIKQFWDHLKRETCQITMIADPKLFKTEAGKKERWMGTEYSFLPLTKTLVKNEMVQVELPRPNPFLPEHLTLHGEMQEKESLEIPVPKVIHETSRAKYFFAADDRFLTPEITWVFSYKTPLIKGSDPKSLVMADLFTYALNKRLNAIAYEAKLGGLNYELTTLENGIHLKVVGYSEKAFSCLKTLIAEMKSFRPKEEEFLGGVEFYKADYKNRLNKTSISQAMDVVSSILYKDDISLSSKIKALKTLKNKDFVAFSEKLFSEGYVEGLLFGNMRENEAADLVHHVDQEWDVKPYGKASHFKKALATLTEDSVPMYFTKKSDQPSNVLVLMLDCGPFSFKKKAALDILTKGLKEPFFTELRTKQQTGYTVHNWSKEVDKHLYAFFLIQSSTHDSRDLLARFELFFENSIANFSEGVIPEERFEKMRTSLITSLEHPAENMQTMGELLFDIAFDYENDFAFINKQIANLKTMTYDSFKEQAKTFIGKKNSKRLAISINGKLSPKDTLTYRPVRTIQKVRENITYKEKK